MPLVRGKQADPGGEKFVTGEQFGGGMGQCRCCDGPALSEHYGTPFCSACLDRIIHEVGAGPEQVPVRRCLRCGGWVVRHDDVIPWRCPDCDTLLRADETSMQSQPGRWSA